MKKENTAEYYEKQLERLALLLREKRSDISDILDYIVEGSEWQDSLVEHRFITGKLPDGTELEYDTLTTEISYLDKKSDTWVPVLDPGYSD